ncbi:hypothetical protein BGX30_006174, partial [Mortierella sp. GBA39]
MGFFVDKIEMVGSSSTAPIDGLDLPILSPFGDYKVDTEKQLIDFYQAKLLANKKKESLTVDSLRAIGENELADDKERNAMATSKHTEEFRATLESTLGRTGGSENSMEETHSALSNLTNALQLEADAARARSLLAQETQLVEKAKRKEEESRRELEKAERAKEDAERMKNSIEGEQLQMLVDAVQGGTSEAGRPHTDSVSTSELKGGTA